MLRLFNKIHIIMFCLGISSDELMNFDTSNRHILHMTLISLSVLIIITSVFILIGILVFRKYRKYIRKASLLAHPKAEG